MATKKTFLVSYTDYLYTITKNREWAQDKCSTALSLWSRKAYLIKSKYGQEVLNLLLMRLYDYILWTKSKNFRDEAQSIINHLTKE
jgi:hypothetical protein